MQNPADDVIKIEGRVQRIDFANDPVKGSRVALVDVYDAPALIVLDYIQYDKFHPVVGDIVEAQVNPKLDLTLDFKVRFFQVKLCQKCVDAIRSSLNVVEGSYPVLPANDVLRTKKRELVEENYCEFWAHQRLLSEASNLSEIIDRAFQDDGKAVIEVSKLREIWRRMTSL